MKIIVDKISDNPVTLLRRAGYVFQRNEADEMSFVRILGRSRYPRFHVYARTDHTSLHINLHLDQKQETYGKAVRHHGEYANEGPVAEEAERLIGLLGENARIVG